MLLSNLSPISRALVFSSSRRILPARCINPTMGDEDMSLIKKRKHATFRLINVARYKTDLLEIPSLEPKLHIFFIPGNPGVISFYTDFLETLYEFLGGSAFITGISHISHSEKDWESGRLFSLQEQISHKISYIEQELQDVEVPIVLVGHSIGSYISLEVFKRCTKKVIINCIGLYPFLAVNSASSTQSFVKRIAASSILCTSVSSLGALLGVLPNQISRFLVRKSIGKTWSSSATEVLCTHVLQYHTMWNVLFMAMTEFQELQKPPDWDFMRGKKSQIAFLFGLDDHWGPLHLYEEICKQLPDTRVDVEREGHTHAFSCSEAGSVWVAEHVWMLITNNLEILNTLNT